MLSKSLVFVGLLLAVQGSWVKLPLGVNLEWEFPAEGTVLYTLHVPTETLKTFGYVGIGISEIVQDRDVMIDSDWAVVWTAESAALDYFDSGNGEILGIDTVFGGTDDLVGFEVHNEDKGNVYQWKKAINTGDKYDVSLTIHGDYNLIYAFGQIVNGQIQEHDGDYIGTMVINLSEEFTNDPETTAFISLIN